MSIAAVRDYFAQFGMADNVLEFSTSSATVELAAQAAGVIPARIAKSLSFKVDGKAILIITAGDANSAIELTCDQLEQYAQNVQGWGDFCKGWQAED